MLREILYPLLNIDVKTLISVLFWGNITSVLLVYSYRFSTSHKQDRALSLYYVLAKSFQSLAYFFLFFRGQLPEFFSVNCGNTFLFIGFYWEARAMLAIIGKRDPKILKACLAILIIAIIGFNTIDFFLPDSSLRVMLASICVFCILVIPNLKLLLTRDVSHFKRLVGVFYLFFLCLLLPRAVYALFYSIDILTNFFIQTLTFLSLVLLMIFTLSAYLLLMKEHTDKLITEMATTDALTGLSNRRSFMEAAVKVFERHRQDKKSLALLFFDIDSFKLANDTYGHGFGDLVLVRLADVIRNSLRNEDLSCRYGGEEFVVMLPSSTTRIAWKVGQRIMEGIASSFFIQQPDFKFTVSIGITDGVPEDGENLDLYLKHADEALYAAKNNGKNMIVEYRKPEAGAKSSDLEIWPYAH
ncbi:hypothetical protein C4J81_01090 [Deltaproteobacteria bacterium Smac51]|nr:hypothetical protein C4J81_01090 [Deltaproteobacteria bacterium Smac51]